MARAWVNFCRQCDTEAAEVTGDPPTEHCEPCGHDAGYYGRLIPVIDPPPAP